MGGDEADWNVWQQIVETKQPTWQVLVLKSLAAGSRFMKASLETLANLAADEVIAAVEHQIVSSARALELHFVGHSMGGLVIRAALPKIVEQQGAFIQLGHYMSLSTPHLGIQAHWRGDFLGMWRNLSFVTGMFSSQLPQLAVQDGSKDTPAFLERLGAVDGQPVELLSKFRHRTCVTVARGDPLIPLVSGVIDPHCKAAPALGMTVPAQWHLKELSEEPEVEPEEVASGFGPGVQSPGPDPDTSSQPSASLSPQSRSPMVASPSKLGRQVSGESGGQAAGESPSVAGASAFGTSADQSCRYPLLALEGLCSLPWRRLVAEVHVPPAARNIHVFLIGKLSEQFETEHHMSRECIAWLMETLCT